MTLIDQIVRVLDYPALSGVKIEDYPDWDMGREPIPEAAQDVVLDVAAQMAAIEAAREILNPAPPLA